MNASSAHGKKTKRFSMGNRENRIMNRFSEMVDKLKTEEIEPIEDYIGAHYGDDARDSLERSMEKEPDDMNDRNLNVPTDDNTKTTPEEWELPSHANPSHGELGVPEQEKPKEVSKWGTGALVNYPSLGHLSRRGVKVLSNSTAVCVNSKCRRVLFSLFNFTHTGSQLRSVAKQFSELLFFLHKIIVYS